MVGGQQRYLGTVAYLGHLERDTHRQQFAIAHQAVARQRIAVEVEQQHVRPEACLDEQPGHDQGVGSVVARTGENDGRPRRAEPFHYLGGNPLGRTVYQLHRTDALVLDCRAVNGAYVVGGKYLHESRVSFGTQIYKTYPSNARNNHL